MKNIESKEDVKWVECGKVGRAVGLKGEVAVKWNNDKSPIEVGEEIFLKVNNGEYKPYKVAALRKQGRSSVMRIEEVSDRTGASKLNNCELFLPKDRLAELSEGEFYSYQILGLKVLDEEGCLLGDVIRIFTAGENDVYEVMPKDGKKGDEILIPAIEGVIEKIDLEDGVIKVHLLDGMLD